jgi:hypothetical protein
MPAWLKWGQLIRVVVATSVGGERFLERRDGRITRHTDGVADLDGVSRNACAAHQGGRTTLQVAFLGLAGRVDHIEIDVHMGIAPQDTRDGTLQFHVAGGVEATAETVVGETAGGQQCEAEQTETGDRAHGNCCYGGDRALKLAQPPG